MVSKDESANEKRIDNIILLELREGLKIKNSAINIISQEELEMVLKKIDEKKRIIFSLFQGDFSVNEKNIGDRIQFVKPQLTFYDNVANNVILSRVEKVMNKLISMNENDNRAISVCMDRKLFIQRILLENVQESFVKKYIEKDVERD